MENVERPHFFPGQWIDYRDFNALSDLPEDTFSLFSRKLVEGGGLAVTAQHEFSVVPREGLLVQVRPGVALLPNGHFVALEQDVLLNLEPFRGRTVITRSSLMSPVSLSSSYLFFDPLLISTITLISFGASAPGVISWSKFIVIDC
jgi:hypothetical protein